MIKFIHTFAVFLLLAINLCAQESKHEFSANIVNGLDRLSYQSVNVGDGNDEFLNDNSIGVGLSYSYRLNQAISIIGSTDFQEIKGSVNSAESDFLNTSNVQKMLNEHLSGKKDHGEIIWEVINLEIWYRKFFGQGL